MTGPVVMSCSRTYPLTVEDAFDRLLGLPLADLFNRWYGPIPSIRATQGPSDWNTVGQSRTIALSGGGSMRETLTRVDRPAAFGYQLTDVKGPMKPLAASVDGLWSFDAVGTGVRISWRWSVTPGSGVGARALPTFAKVWHGYARRALDRIEELLLPA
jgi:polyketide cyclase/dehydrase/lipid transport protein